MLSNWGYKMTKAIKAIPYYIILFLGLNLITSLIVIMNMENNFLISEKPINTEINLKKGKKNNKHHDIIKICHNKQHFRYG